MVSAGKYAYAVREIFDDSPNVGFQHRLFRFDLSKPTVGYPSRVNFYSAPRNARRDEVVTFKTYVNSRVHPFDGKVIDGKVIVGIGDHRLVSRSKVHGYSHLVTFDAAQLKRGDHKLWFQYIGCAEVRDSPKVTRKMMIR